MTSRDRTNVATRGVLTRLESRKSFFCRGFTRTPLWSLRRSPMPPNRLGGDTPSPFFTPVEAFGASHLGVLIQTPKPIGWLWACYIDPVPHTTRAASLKMDNWTQRLGTDIVWVKFRIP